MTSPWSQDPRNPRYTEDRSTRKGVRGPVGVSREEVTNILTASQMLVASLYSPSNSPAVVTINEAICFMVRVILRFMYFEVPLGMFGFQKPV